MERHAHARNKNMYIMPILQSRVYKMKKNNTFSQKNLHISKKSCTFASDFKKQHYKQLKLLQL